MTTILGYEDAESRQLFEAQLAAARARQVEVEGLKRSGQMKDEGLFETNRTAIAESLGQQGLEVLYCLVDEPEAATLLCTRGVKGVIAAARTRDEVVLVTHTSNRVIIKVRPL